MHQIRPELGSQEDKHHTRHVLRLDQVDLCFDYLLPGGETRRGFDQERLSHTSACVLFTAQSRAAGVQDTSTAPAASCPTTLAPLSHVPTAGCVCPKLRGTCATARWTTPTHGKHKIFYSFLLHQACMFSFTDLSNTCVVQNVFGFTWWSNSRLVCGSITNQFEQLQPRTLLHPNRFIASESILGVECGDVSGVE